MSRILAILFSTFYACVYSQDVAAYNAIYSKTLLEISQRDFQKAIKIADSLYTISETPAFKTRSLMLSASLFQQSGDREKAIDYALQSEQLMKDTDNYIWKAKIYGFLATQYRFLDLYEQSKKYSDLTLDAAKKITNPEAANNIMGLMMQEIGYYNLNMKQYKKSIESINKAEVHFENTKQDKTFFTANNEQLLGLNYYHLRDFKRSLEHYQKALEVSKNMPENYMTSLIHSGLSVVFLEKKDLKKAKEHLDIAQRIADQSKFLAVKNEVYEASKKYFAYTKDIEELVKTDKKQDTVKEILNKKERVYVGKSYSKIDKQNVEIKKTDSAKTSLIIISCMCLVLGVLYFIMYRKKQKKNIEEFKKILVELDKKIVEAKEKSSAQKVFQETNIGINNNIGERTEEHNRIPAATTEKILAKLMEFENSELFTENDMSLSRLAIYCETNTKYLSSVINSFKDKDFNNYINDLRINYIIHKLRTVPLYRKYKVATLAEEAGFSSYNKFSMVFKKTTTISPSLFIKYLEETK